MPPFAIIPFTFVAAIAIAIALGVIIAIKRNVKHGVATTLILVILATLALDAANRRWTRVHVSTHTAVRLAGSGGSMCFFPPPPGPWAVYSLDDSPGYVLRLTAYDNDVDIPLHRQVTIQTAATYEFGRLIKVEALTVNGADVTECRTAWDPDSSSTR